MRVAKNKKRKEFGDTYKGDGQVTREEGKGRKCLISSLGGNVVHVGNGAGGGGGGGGKEERRRIDQREKWEESLGWRRVD